MPETRQGFRLDQPDVHWRAVVAGYILALAGTLVLGTAAFLWDPNVWWIAASGVISLFGGDVLAGRVSGSPEPLNGALVGVGYFTTVAVIIFAAAGTDVLPDPLPGLPKGDSTLFMAWPLGQLAASTLGPFPLAGFPAGGVLGHDPCTVRYLWPWTTPPILAWPSGGELSWDGC